MDELVRKIEIPLAKNAIEKAGLYIIQEKDLDHLAMEFPARVDSYITVDK